MVTKALLISILMWISVHTKYDMTPARVPTVMQHTQGELNHLIYGDTECAGKTPSNIIAAYTRYDNTVHLNDVFSERNPEDISSLVHELAHHAQHTYEKRAPRTFVWREREAIRIENKWRVAHGLEEIDRIVSAEPCA